MAIFNSYVTHYQRVADLWVMQLAQEKEEIVANETTHSAGQLRKQTKETRLRIEAYFGVI